MKPVVVIVGPTASGKTELAKHLARTLNGEVISADSRQVYKLFDIGTAKDASFPQHLVGDIDPRKEQFTASDFLNRAKELIDKIHGRGRLPIVVGGTGLYLDALIRGYHFPRGKRFRGQFRGRASPLNCRFLVIGIKRTRQQLYQNIVLRSQKMVSNGLVGETNRLLKILPKHHELLKTIGYKQTIDYLEGKISRDELVAAITRATKRLVHHQANWLKRWPVVWLRNTTEATERVKQFIAVA